MSDKKANEACEKFELKQSNEMIQYYHEVSLHGTHYLHKSNDWNMRDLKLLTDVCEGKDCVFTMINSQSVMVWSDENIFLQR